MARAGGHGRGVTGRWGRQLLYPWSTGRSVLRHRLTAPCPLMAGPLCPALGTGTSGSGSVNALFWRVS